MRSLPIICWSVIIRMVAGQPPEILPFGPFTLSPTTLALHYGQTIFEGMKAFRTEDGRIHIFRPDRHYERLVRTAERMCMPTPPAGVFYGRDAAAGGTG